MKRNILFIFTLALILVALENCKHEPKTTIVKTTTTEADSAYIGTKYVIGSNALTFEFPGITNPYKDSLTVEGIQLGRMLFYDKHLSVNGQMACASCHILSHSFADTIPIATNVFGPNKRKAPRLVNLAWEPYMFWDGRQPTIAAQAQDASHNELGMVATNAVAYLQADTVYAKLFKKAFGKAGATVNVNQIYLGIQEFLMTAISINSRFDSVMRGQATFTQDETAAFYAIFIQTTGECFHCHSFGGNYLMANYLPGQTFRNDGLQAATTINDYADAGRGAITGVPSDYGLFKNPSLRNVAVSGPYMHDGRYKTLDQVINFYSDSLKYSPNMDQFIALHIPRDSSGNYLPVGGLHLTTTAKAQLLTLLNDMTDTSYLNNPAFKDPF
jgi:cytochrome c peroxidase